jgi:hypothetical protein
MSVEQARRIWHRQRGEQGLPCPTAAMCEAFDAGYAAAAGKLLWLETLMKHCPHADLTYNDDDDGMDGPHGFSLIVEGCSRLELHAPTLAALIDLGITAKPDEDGNVVASAKAQQKGHK